MIPLMLVLFIATLDQTIVAASLPTIARAIGNSDQITWVTTAYLLTSAVTTLIFGKLGDLFGRKAILQIALGIFLIGSLFSGISDNIWFLIIARAFQGIGGGGLNTLCMVVIADLVPARERSRYLGIAGLVPAVALIAGPFLGGFITDIFSWHWIFFINLPIGILSLILIASYLKLANPNHDSGVKIDISGSLLITVGTTTLLLTLSLAGSTFAWASLQIISLFLVALLSLIDFVFVESHTKEPITPISFFKSSIFSISSLQFFLATAALFVGMVFTPMYFSEIRGYSATAASSSIIPMLIGLMIASSLFGEVIAHTGHYKYLAVLGSLLIGLASLLLIGLAAHTALWLILLALFIMGFGQGAMIQVALVAGQNAVPYQQIGAATGALNFFKSLGGSFASAIFAIILTNSHSFGRTFFWIVPLMILSLILGLFMPEKPLSKEMIDVAAGKEEVPEY